MFCLVKTVNDIYFTIIAQKLREIISFATHLSLSNMLYNVYMRCALAVII